MTLSLSTVHVVLIERVRAEGRVTNSGSITAAAAPARASGGRRSWDENPKLRRHSPTNCTIISAGSLVFGEFLSEKILTNPRAAHSNFLPNISFKTKWLDGAVA